MHQSVLKKGFTLIELMIVVIIIGVLAAIAYPSYVENTRAATRSTAQADLMQLASFMERNFSEANRYDQDASGSAINTAALPFNQTPRTGTSRYNYTIAFSSTSPCTTATCFTLTATPVNGQATDSCGNLTYNQAGIKTASGTGTCWR
jgi:type IV pilus assembly protein PilE